MSSQTTHDTHCCAPKPIATTSFAHLASPESRAHAATKKTPIADKLRLLFIMGGMPELPPRFPCWCRATYSWGGETKKDLGFIEGDLIEALNAGDGLWWMGRLRRDPRAIGIFPSNFVKVLDEGFQPAPNSRNASPQTQATTSTSPAKSKSAFRKPFDAYERLGPKGSLENVRSREGTPDGDKEKPRKEKSKFRPYASMKTAQAPTGSFRKQGSASPLKEDTAPRIPDPVPRGRISRAASPRPSASPTPTPRYAAPTASSIYRAASPRPSSRAPSPAPSRSHSPLPSTYHDGSAYPQLLPMSRQPSPNPYEQQFSVFRPPSRHQSFDYHDQVEPTSLGSFPDDDIGSSPPPPPPAHRVAYQPSRAPSPVPTAPQHGHNMVDRGGSRTPVPLSPGGGSHMTPSPLRDAMNDVMSSLQDMSVLQNPSPPRTSNFDQHETIGNHVWSPDAFEMIRTASQQHHQRAHSSLGFAQPRQYDGGDDVKTLPQAPLRTGQPQLESYVQRMERQLQHKQSSASFSFDHAPLPPLKCAQYSARPSTSSSQSSNESHGRSLHSQRQHPNLRHRKSAFELGRDAINRTNTTKTNATNATNSTDSSSATQSSNSTQLTSRSIMSGYSAGGFSATSAGSLARRKFGLGSQRGKRPFSVVDSRSTGDLASSARSMVGSEASGSGPSYHESHASRNQPLLTPVADWTKDPTESAGVLGGLGAPKAKKSRFFKKMIETAKTTARTGAANARSTIGSATGSRPGSRAGSPTKSLLGNGPTAISGGTLSRPGSAFGGGAAHDMGLGAGNDWMQVRRDINRSNSLSRREREERAERCEMLDVPVFRPIELLHEVVEGDESLDGLPVADPTDFNTPNLALVDKSTRFVQSVAPTTTATALAQNYVCRPHRSDVQRLRAIFTWVAERITWEEDFEGQIDTRRVVQSKRGCSEEVAVLVRDMCSAVGLHAEIVHGYLRGPGEVVDLDMLARPNHWWNVVIVDGEWRIMDCSLASPTHPRRSAYSTASSQVAEGWYFLARPMEICYTHIPLLPEQQHLVPPIGHDILVALPFAGPTYFRNTMELTDFDTSLLHLEGLEMVHVHINVPEDVECVAETEARAFAQDMDGDVFESGELVTKKAFAQAEWVGGRKRFTVKAVLPSDEGQAVLKIYAGKRGLMHSIKDNPHSLSLALPVSHTGQNPPYDFHIRHPTPHAQRHDLYIAQPQCARLTMNNTFVFCVRQHPSSLSRFTPDTWGANGGANRPASPNPYARPTSAMSMVSATMSTTGSSYSDGSHAGQPMTAAQQKPAKLAIQTPSQRIIRLSRKQEHTSRPNEESSGLTTSWETVIKIGERGTWRGLVLADRSARWCVFAEWECT